MKRFIVTVKFPPLACARQDKEIYRWPIKESIKAMLAWEWTLEKARDGEGDVEKKAATRKISQTAQVLSREAFGLFWKKVGTKQNKQKTFLSPGYIRSQPWLQPSTDRHHRNGFVSRAAGLYQTYLSHFFPSFKLHQMKMPLFSVFSPWPSSWLKTTTTRGAERKSWSFSPKVGGFLRHALAPVANCEAKSNISFQVAARTLCWCLTTP